MAKQIVIDPVTRIEGHAKITIQLDDDGTVQPFLKTPFRLERGPDVPRAELEDVYWQNGVVDVTRREVVREQRVMIGRRVAGLVTRPEESIDIDTEMDLALAELLYARRQVRA